MPHVIFVWTGSDIFHAVVGGVLICLGLLVGAVFLYEKARRFVRRKFGAGK